MKYWLQVQSKGGNFADHLGANEPSTCFEQGKWLTTKGAVCRVVERTERVITEATVNDAPSVIVVEIPNHAEGYTLVDVFSSFEKAADFVSAYHNKFKSGVASTSRVTIDAPDYPFLKGGEDA
jgi:hypothetical protein